MCNNCGCKNAEEEEDVESFDLEEQQAQAIQACNARGYHDFEYTFNPEHFQEWAEEKIANLNDTYDLLGLQYPETEQYRNHNYGNIRRPPRIATSYPIFHGVTCADCGTKLEGLEGAYNNQYIYTIEGAEEEMASVTGVYQDNMLRYLRQNYPQFYDDEGNWIAYNTPRYRNVAGNMNQQTKLNLIMNMGPSVQCNNCNTYCYPQLDDPESAASQWLRNQYGNGMIISRHTQEAHQAGECSPLTEEECEQCGGMMRWGGNSLVSEEEARAKHGEGNCVSTIIQCGNCNRDYVILKQGARYGDTVMVNYEGEPRPVLVRGPHYDQSIGNAKYRHANDLFHISEINWEEQADNFVGVVKGYANMQHFELVHNERPPKVAGGEAQPSLCSDGVAQVMPVAKLKNVMRGLGKGSYWKGWNKKEMVLGIGARWNDELKKAKRVQKPKTVEIREKPVDKKNVLEYMKSLQENDPDLYDEMMEEMFGAENFTDKYIQVNNEWPKRVEIYMDTVLFYVGKMATIRYGHDGVVRKELGSKDRIISIIDPMGIKVEDVEKILNREWDGTYFLFEEGGTIMGGLQQYEAEEWRQVECEMCDRQGYSDEMMAIKTVKGPSYLCSRCSRPDINWDKIYPPNKLDMKTYGVSMLGLFVLGILMRRKQRNGSVE
jgi:hypothetical protein